MISRAAIVALLASTLLGVAALAQPAIPPSGDRPDGLTPDSPGPVPNTPPLPDAARPVPEIAGKPAAPQDERKAVDELLGRLATTQDPQAAKRIAGAVQAMWSRSGSDTIDLLTSRAAEAQRSEKLDVARKLLDEVVGMEPDYAEGWNKRATMHFMARDFDEAMADIHETLIREPRHFGAWIGLGRILADSGFDAKALAAYRKAIEIYPAIDGLKKQVDELTLKVEGQPI